MAVAKFKIDESERDTARKGANFIGRAGSDLVGGLFLKTAKGKRIHLELPAKLLTALQTFIGFAAKGEVLVVDREDELSPEEAAKLLRISRPMVYQRMDAGKLHFREVGTHRRVLLSDVLKLKEAEDRRRSFASALGADTEDLEANYAQPAKGAR